ncbi:MAG: hypothetical protein ACLT98_06690 [Eggerthellaceae bacterium]
MQGSGENKWGHLWDEALDLAAERITSTIDKRSIFVSPVSVEAALFVHGGNDASPGLRMPTVFEPGCQCYLPVMPWRNTCTAATPIRCRQRRLEIFKVEDNKAGRGSLGTQPSVSQTAESGRGMAELRTGRQDNRRRPSQP